MGKLDNCYNDHFQALEALDGGALPDIFDEHTEARCKALVRVLTSILWLSDPVGRVLTPQASWSAYTGQQWPTPREFGWLEAIHPDDRDRLRAAWGEARASACRLSLRCRVWHAASGSFHHNEVNGVPICNEDGTVKEWIGTCKDIEDRVLAEAILMEEDRRKDDFIAVLAHELRNPLAPIRNAIQVLKLRGTGDMQLSWARGIIERQVAQMAHLLDDLLDVSRIRQNKMELHKARVTLDSVLDAAIEASRPLWEQNGQTFELIMLAGPIYIDADASRLTQAFTNILNNAAKYTNRGGRISMTVRRLEDKAVVEIEDTGIGISEEMMPRLFRLFAQDGSTLDRSQGGLGIGLSIVKAIIDLHEGSVEVASAGPGTGSRFTVSLPASGQRGGAGAADARQPPQLKILIADDNLDAGETLSVLLEMLGHEVRLARDGEEALAMCRDFAPDVALLDLGMPNKNGYEVARELAVIRPQTRLIAVTGWGQTEDMNRSKEAGFEQHLVKPVDPELLTRVVETMAASLQR